jgi:starch-binding outer membrane protein, SusD/RagB family
MRLARHIHFVTLALGLTACNAAEQILDVTDPDVINPTDIQTAAAAEALRIGALARLNLATSGDESFLLLGGLLGDEYRSGDTFTERNEADRRNVSVENTNVRDAFRNSYRARISALQAIEALERFNADAWRIAEMYLVIAYAENQLAETACSGIPLSTVEGTRLVYDAPHPTAEVLASALASVDNALQRATGTGANDVRVRRAASVLKGRILWNLGKTRFAEAAAAVAAVPTDYEYQEEHSETSLTNAIWILNNSVGRWVVSNGEGGNTINYATAGDPRVPVCRGATSTTTGAGGLPTCPAGTAGRAFDASARVIPLFVQEVWPTRDSPVAIISGVEARLIEAEAALNAGDVTTFLAIHNALRTRVSGLAPLTDPGTAAGREDLHFREKAFWLFGRGFRLGDMRRLIRQYGRNSEAVFGTGAWFKGGNFGTDVNFPIPQAEENNPEFPKNQSCIDRNG